MSAEKERIIEAMVEGGSKHQANKPENQDARQQGQETESQRHNQEEYNSLIKKAADNLWGKDPKEDILASMIEGGSK